MIDLGSIVIKCDHKGCGERLDAKTSSPHRARDVARREGWSTRLTRDSFAQAVEYCPAHRDEHDADTIEGRGF